MDEEKEKGWEITRTEYDFDREVYGWRAEVRGSPSPTLRISQAVLEDYPAWAVLYISTGSGWVRPTCNPGAHL